MSRVPHLAVRFADDPVAAAKVREVNNGDQISPTVRVGEQFLTNPSVREIRRVRDL